MHADNQARWRESDSQRYRLFDMIIAAASGGPYLDLD